MNTGIITTIQRMSIHDGPGIRSTVFLKGCNLRCRWCHNPETWSSHRQLMHVVDRCIGCGCCVAVCPEHALSLQAGKLKVNRLRCLAEGVCTEACLQDALQVVGRVVPAQSLVDELMEDVVFFEESGGGVTLSGGEPLMQPGFALEILQECRRRGIHTALETNLTASWETIHSFLPWVDLWMCDLKLADRDRHKTWTGAYNDQIIGNLYRLSEAGVPVVLRTPVVPDVNDNASEISAICRLATAWPNVLYYELLEFHALGFDKFRNLGMENPLLGIRKLDAELFRSLKQIPGTFGLRTKPE